MSPEPQLIESQHTLVELVAQVRQHSRLAFDTESASFHRYVDRVYLMQVSSDSVTAVVDPLAVDDLTPIGHLLSDPGTEVVFHDADYDLRTLDRDYGFRARNIFDTRVAAQLAGEPSVGLRALLEKYVGVSLDKKHQRADWSRRPLPRDMLAYAAADTQYLLELRDSLDRRLRELDRREWAVEEFQRLEEIRWTGANGPADVAFLKLKGARALRGRSLAALQQLFAWRDETARGLDRAPFRVLGNAALVAVARAMPNDMAALRAIDDLPDKLAARYGSDLLRAVRVANGLPSDRLPRVPRGERPVSDAAYDARMERLKALRNERASAVGLDPGLVCPNGTLGAVARRAPAQPAELALVDELRRWQREILGDDRILDAVAG